MKTYEHCAFASRGLEDCKTAKQSTHEWTVRVAREWDDHVDAPLLAGSLTSSAWPPSRFFGDTDKCMCVFWFVKENKNREPSAPHVKTVGSCTTAKYKAVLFLYPLFHALWHPPPACQHQGIAFKCIRPVAATEIISSCQPAAVTQLVQDKQALHIASNAI